MKMHNWLNTHSLRILNALVVAFVAITLAGCGDSGIDNPVNAQELVSRENQRVSLFERQRTSPQAAASNVRNVDVKADVATLIESLEAAHADTELELRRAGYSDVVDAIKTVDGIQLYDIEAEALVREVAYRAETHTAGQGRRVLAHLYTTGAEQFPAMASDPAFEELRQIVQTTPAEGLDPANFRFASSPSDSLKSLGSSLDNAIVELGYVYSNGNLSELNRLVSRAFSRGSRAPSNTGRTLVPYLARAKTVPEAINRFVQEHVPPPNSKEAIAEVMRQTNRLPAVAQRQPFQAALAQLNPDDLGFDTERDANYRRLADAQDTLPSRAKQARQAESIGALGSVTSSGDDSVGKVLAEALPSGVQGAVSAVNSSGGVSRSRSAQHFASYKAASFEGGSSVSSRAPGGGGSGSRAYTVTRPPTSYAARVASSGAPKVARTYRTAIRSARAARGVAAGANVEVPKDYSPFNLAWVANPDDDRFGRIVMEVVNHKDATTSLVATRTLFADSFHVAADVLWGGHYGYTAFKEGEILVVMSMDPFDVVDEEKTEEIANREASLIRRAEQLSDDDIAANFSLMQEAYELRSLAQQLPRRIVVHPAAYGTELAWSVARVDFWFNDINGLSNEGAMMNGGHAMPTKFRGIDISAASTWQFFERESSVMLNLKKDGLGQLLVQSGTGKSASDRSHYAVSMFVFDPDSNNPEGRRLPQLEKSVQPMLDWLSVNHHDFMRLNDFSEAFSILRWARVANVSPLVLDVDGPPEEIATPDRVVIGDGPRVK